MNNKLPMDEVVQQLATWLQKNAKTPKEQALLARGLFDALSETLPKNTDATDHITAPNAVVEVVAEGSGLLYRRYLELEYEENDNGIRLMGEAMDGSPAQIVFLSESALKKLHELRGEGPNAPQCDSHR